MAYYWWEAMNRFLQVQSSPCELGLQKKNLLLSGKVPGRQKQLNDTKALSVQFKRRLGLHPAEIQTLERTRD